MTKFTARTIGTQDTPAYALTATTLAHAKVEADTILGDMFRGDELLIEFKNQFDMPTIAASRVIGHKNWVDALAASYLQ